MGDANPTPGLFMTKEDFELHALVIRLLKGIVNGYENWFKKKQQMT